MSEDGIHNGSKDGGQSGSRDGGHNGSRDGGHSGSKYNGQSASRDGGHSGLGDGGHHGSKDGGHQGSRASRRKKAVILSAVAILLLLAGTALAMVIISPDDAAGGGEGGDGGGYATIFSPSEWVGVVPASGTWSFAMTGGGDYLHGDPAHCPVGNPVTISSSGTAELSVSPDGGAATMLIDGKTLSFNGVPEDYTNFYRTATISTPYEGGVGDAYIDFVANTYETIVGTIHWDNNKGCAGDYPFTMELIEMAIPDGIDLPSMTPGAWNIDFDAMEGDCNGWTFAGFTGLPQGEVQIEYGHDLDNNDIDLSTLEMSFDSHTIVLADDDGDNNFQQVGSGYDPGLPYDGDGDLLLDFEDVTFNTEFEIYVPADNFAYGKMTVTGGGCSFQIGFTMDYAG